MLCRVLDCFYVTPLRQSDGGDRTAPPEIWILSLTFLWAISDMHLKGVYLLGGIRQSAVTGGILYALQKRVDFEERKLDGSIERMLWDLTWFTDM
ncbi:hypothetical protein NPIL_575931 [Nephila pilipes]|uniref:Uncharacterized protein n=1 Tax=Nephila pilipes TaxID=299642 RepID=A0A8X6P490_NEPPI|nr:hypothetical protein NPIL_575931 [Nephila pilipes]